MFVSAPLDTLLTTSSGMFEGDQDEDMAAEIGFQISGENPSEEFAWVYFFTTGYPDEKHPDIDAAAVCEKLDSGLGEKLFNQYRETENTSGGSLFEEGRLYLVIILAAMMMRCGAKIREEDRQHLREIFPAIPSREGYMWSLCDNGFRGPGKRQFLAALDHYQTGTPRSFSHASCFACGKTNTDLASPLLRCGGCDGPAWFCDKVRLAGYGWKWQLANIFVAQECQRAYWKHHKKMCGPRKSMMLNV